MVVRLPRPDTMFDRDREWDALTPFATDLWRRSQQRFTSAVVGPHFEHVCRYRTRDRANRNLLGADVHHVGRAR